MKIIIEYYHLLYPLTIMLFVQYAPQKTYASDE